jgi:hypothetical protein
MQVVEEAAPDYFANLAQQVSAAPRRLKHAPYLRSEPLYRLKMRWVQVFTQICYLPRLIRHRHYIWQHIM